jgi:hypothetical protein
MDLTRKEEIALASLRKLTRARARQVVPRLECGLRELNLLADDEFLSADDVEKVLKALVAKRLARYDDPPGLFMGGHVFAPT